MFSRENFPLYGNLGNVSGIQKLLGGNSMYATIDNDATKGKLQTMFLVSEI